MGGSDQWGNITTGTELIRRMEGGEAFAITAPLITKSDGTKFGKSEGGNVWLDPNRTSPFKFYQFWLNVADDDAIKFIKIYSLKSREEIQQLIDNHIGNEYQRSLQKALAEELTERVHSESNLNMAIKATEIFFGNGSKEDLLLLDENTLSASLEGMEKYSISLNELENGVGVLDLLASSTQIFASKGEARKMLQANGFSINKEKFTDVNAIVNKDNLLHNKFIVAQKGKKQYYVIEVI
jgi:tyrosyl-tRNA synthetase